MIGYRPAGWVFSHRKPLHSLRISIKIWKNNVNYSDNSWGMATIIGHYLRLNLSMLRICAMLSGALDFPTLCSADCLEAVGNANEKRAGDNAAYVGRAG
jgi:hypothetical protein